MSTDVYNIRAVEWNADAEVLDRARLWPGTGTRVRRHGGAGVTLEALPGGVWKHPWFTAPLWDPAGGRWVARVKPGFVNGLDPVVPGAGEDGEDARLLDRPDIVLGGFRHVGAAADDPAPRFFHLLGVPDARGRTWRGLPPRTLRASDLILRTARAALQGNVEVVDATGTSGTIAQYRVGLDTTRVDQVGVRARIGVTARWVPPPPPSVAERMLGIFRDETEDVTPICTVYLLAPERTDDAPDANWAAFVRHHLFWNLRHAPRNLRPPEPPAPIILFTGLAGGIGDAIGNQILANINDLSDRVFNALNNTTNEGRYWT